jgi:3-phosphoshikimate 1-carboxyvinyltransferase
VPAADRNSPVDLLKPITELPRVLAMPAPPATFDAAVTPPGSKSLTNRALLLAGLARGESRVSNCLRDADDARRMIAAIQQLGAGVRDGPGGSLVVTGVDGRWRVPPEGVRLALGNAGTAARFLAASAMLANGPVTIDGDARMRERPIGELGDVLGKLGCGVVYEGSAGCPPVKITPPSAGAPSPLLEVPTTQSSQFISGILMAAPWLSRGLTVRLVGEITSAPYIAMTLGLLAQVGATVRHSEDLRVLRIGGAEGQRGLPAFEYAVEPDASGATYFWGAAAAVPGARCRVEGLDVGSLQGDARFPEVLRLMGVKVGSGPGYIETMGTATLKPILADMSEMPDAAMTLAAVACFANGTSILRGLRTLRVKESDRIAAMHAELTKLGVAVQTPVQGDKDAMTITPPVGGMDCSASAPPVEFETYNDHRIAMSLALIALRRPNITIRNPACVAKTYPTFWADFAKLR